MMKLKIMASAIVICIALTAALGGTMAYFSDTETSSGNTFTAGTLNLKIDGQDTNVVKFTQGNMSADDQPVGSYLLKNTGSLGGYLNITSFAVVNTENDIGEPEAEAGDQTLGVGELGNVLNIRLYFDNDKDGYYSTGDDMFYNGLISDLQAGGVKTNKIIAAGSEVRINAVIDWWATANDNIAQSDSVSVDMTFSLTEKSA